MSLLFELLQVAIGARTELTKVPSCNEWCCVFDEACKQAVAGVAFYGVSLLGEKGIRPPQELLLKWIGVSEVMERQRNEDLNKKCVELINRFEKEGYNVTILKGQGIALLYDDTLQTLRQAGDIDIYVSGGLSKAYAFAKGTGQKDIKWDYKHLHFNIWNDVEIEIHYHVEVLYNLIQNRKLQKWFRDNEESLFEKQGDLITPTLEMNVFYILLHIYRHFFTEGVGFRQLMDYFFVLRRFHEEGNSGQRFIDAVRQFGMERFAKGVMWVMQEVFAMPKEWMLWSIDEKEGSFILAQVLDGGNFGHYAEKKNLLKGSLKYAESLTRHSLNLLRRYPSEALWTPIWIVWHKCWKVYMKRQLA